MEKDFIIIKTFSQPGDETMARSYLEMMGIDTFMKNLVASRLSYPIGGIQMQVKIDDYQKAKEALIEGGFSKPEDFKSE